MKLIGSLENFQPSSLLQWFQTERADGVLAVHSGPGYRLRFEGGELVAAAHWPPAESLERRLRRHLEPDRAGQLRLAAELEEVPLADLLVEALGAGEAARLVVSHAEGVVFRLLEERTGRFFFDPPARGLPPSLRTRLNVSRILLECARRHDEEERLADWIPAATSPLRLLKDPVSLDDTASGIRGALVEGLREPRSRRELEAMIPVESHAVRLKLAELIRSGNVEILPEASAPPGLFEASAASTPASVLCLAKSPTADDWPFLTRAEAGLLDGLREGPLSLDEASRALRRDRQEVTPVAELLADSGWISVKEPRARSPIRIGVLAGAAAAGFLAVLSLLLFLPRLSRETSFHPPPPVAEAAPPLAAESPEAEQEAEEVAEPTAEEARDSAPEDPEPEAPDSGASEPETAEPETAEPEAPEPGTSEPAAIAAPEAAVREPVPAPRAGTAPAAEPLPAPAEPVAEAPAKLMVNAIPYGYVRINGEEKGPTPLHLELAPGSYEIRVYRAGYGTVVRRVELAAATVFLESFTLERDEAEEEIR